MVAPTPTKAEIWQQLSDNVTIPDELFKYATENTPNYLDLEDTIITGLKGVHSNLVLQGLSNFRNGLNGLYSQYQATLSAILLELARVGYDSVEDDLQAAIDDIYDGMILAGETIESRAFTFGLLVTAGGNTGDGTVYRLTKDRNNFNLESGAPVGGDILIEARSDKNNGELSGNELFRISGKGLIPVDNLDLGTAPAPVQEIRALRSVDGLLVNGSFDELNDTLVANETGWDLSDPAKFTKEIVDFFRLTPGLTTGVAIKFNDNANITQFIATESISLDPGLPTFLIVRFLRKNTADGTLTIRLGSQTEIVSIASVSNDVWTDITLGTGTSTKGWYDNFKEDNNDGGVRIQIDLSARTTGEVVIDEIIMIQPEFYDGRFYSISAGENDFLRLDNFSFVDTVLNTGRNQLVFTRLLGRYLPHQIGGPTYPDS